LKLMYTRAGLCNGTSWLALCGCTQRLACCCRCPAGLHC
jgi:hypothetical protein